MIIFNGLFLKIDLQENFPTLICHPSGRKFIYLAGGGGGGWHKTQKIPQKLKGGK
jgi:hypothetical protein